MKFSGDEDSFADVSVHSSGSRNSTQSKLKTSANSNLPGNYKEIKARIRGITDLAKLKGFVLEHDGEMSQYTTALLNTWCAVPGCKFNRNKGVLGVVKIAETRYRCINTLCQEVDALRAENAELKNAVDELRGEFAKMYRTIYSS